MFSQLLSCVRVVVRALPLPFCALEFLPLRAPHVQLVARSEGASSPSVDVLLHVARFPGVRDVRGLLAVEALDFRRGRGCCSFPRASSQTPARLPPPRAIGVLAFGDLSTWALKCDGSTGRWASAKARRAARFGDGKLPRREDNDADGTARAGVTPRNDWPEGTFTITYPLGYDPARGMLVRGGEGDADARVRLEKARARAAGGGGGGGTAPGRGVPGAHARSGGRRPRSPTRPDHPADAHVHMLFAVDFHSLPWAVEDPHGVDLAKFVTGDDGEGASYVWVEYRRPGSVPHTEVRFVGSAERGRSLGWRRRGRRAGARVAGGGGS